MLNELTGLDVEILRFFNQSCRMSLLDKIVPYITDSAHAAVFIAGLLLFLARRRTARLAGLLLMAGGTFSYYAVEAIKSLVQRPRPYLVLENINAILPATGFSCPSGHTSISFMAAFVLTSKFGKWYIFYPLAFIVGFTRMYLGVHYPSDVLAGALLGTAIGLVLVKLTDNFDDEIL